MHVCVYMDTITFYLHHLINNSYHHFIIQTSWVYCEDISQDFAYSQSVLFKIFGENVQETGHKTKGHLCVTESDKEVGKSGKGSLLYGELLPRGANKVIQAFICI